MVQAVQPIFTMDMFPTRVCQGYGTVTTGIPRTFCTKCVHCTEDLVKNICIKVIAKFSLKSVVTDDWFAVPLVGEDEFVCTCILATPKTVAHVGYANSSSLFIFSVLPAKSV